ncbi:MAG TPA: SBBP repeat-containing protein [Pyrinomonadaceae bacterium]|nr:SBBP repeat-containing protein [Pyrinomonadaceae bacterium]
MNSAQKIKIIPMLLLLWALPMSMLPRVTAKPHATAPASQPTSTPNEAQLKMTASENYGKLPLSFERNQGQSDEAVEFLSRGKGYTLFLTTTEAVFSLRNSEKKTSALRMKLIGADVNAQINGEQELQGKVNYMIGNDRAKWRTGIPTFRKVRYDNVWPGVDMIWYGSQNKLEYDFVIKPCSDVAQIRLFFAGSDELRTSDKGDLLMKVNSEEMVQSTPQVYQDLPQGRVTIPARYLIKGTHEVSFEVGTYDISKPLVIDPVLSYSTYIGGDSTDTGLSVAADGSGRAYIAGQSSSDETSFPLENAIQQTQISNLGFVTRLNATGDDVLYSTFLGDDNGFCTGNVCGTQVNGIAVTSDGRAVVTGQVTNEDDDSKFPVTPNAYQRNGACISWCGLEPNRMVDAFVTMFSADGTQLVYSTFYGGWTNYRYSERGFDIGNSIAVDSSTRIYITGLTASNTLPNKHGFQGSRASEGDGKDAFIAVFNPLAANGNDTLLYSSYYGGDGDDVGLGIAVDADRNAYIVGSTASTDLETKSPALSPLRATFQGGGFDGFVAKIDTEADGNASLTYSTYFGGNINDRVESVAVDAFQRAYITGASNSSAASFPLRNAFDSTQTNGEAFVAKLNADGTALFYSSFLGGNNGNTPSDGEEGLGIAIDFAGNAYVTGRTTSGASFPAVLPLASNLQGTAFLTKIEATVANNVVPKVLYSTTFGGSGARGESIALDPQGNVFLGGTSPGTLPTTAGAFDTTFNGGTSDAFVAKFQGTFNDTIGVFRSSINQFQLRDSNTTGAADHLITFGQSGDQPIVGDWNGTGTDKVGVFRPSTGQFLLQISAFKTITVNFGQAGQIAVAGDWDGNGIDTPGVFNPATGQWLLTNGIGGVNVNNSFPVSKIAFVFGQNGDTPITGDWDGDGKDSVGTYTDATSVFRLSNGFAGTVDFTPVVFGNINTRPIAGDWNGDGVDTIGVFNQVTAVMALNNAIIAGDGEIVFNFGQAGDIPLAGDWDGKPTRP